MENASKALLIAGGFLIAIMLLTIFNYVFRDMADTTSDIYEMLDTNEIEQFNQQFFNYQVSTLRVQDVATLINLANEANKNYSVEIKIYLGSKDDAQDLAKQNTYTEWLEKKINSQEEYICETIHVNEETLLVDYVIIKTKT